MTQKRKISGEEKAIRIGGAGVCAGLGLIFSVFAVRAGQTKDAASLERAGKLGLITSGLFGLVLACVEPMIRRDTPAVAAPAADAAVEPPAQTA